MANAINNIEMSRTLTSHPPMLISPVDPDNRAPARSAYVPTVLSESKGTLLLPMT